MPLQNDLRLLELLWFADSNLNIAILKRMKNITEQTEFVETGGGIYSKSVLHLAAAQAIFQHELTTINSLGMTHSVIYGNSTV